MLVFPFSYYLLFYIVTCFFRTGSDTQITDTQITCRTESCGQGPVSVQIYYNDARSIRPNPQYIFQENPNVTDYDPKEAFMGWECLQRTNSLRRMCKFPHLKVIYHPLYGMNNYVLIWGDWLSCDPLRGSHDSQSPHISGDCLLCDPLRQSHDSQSPHIRKHLCPILWQLWFICHKFIHTI